MQPFSCGAQKFVSIIVITIALAGCGKIWVDANESTVIQELIPDNEAFEIVETAEIGRRLQQIRAKRDSSQSGRILRGVHAKSHGCVAARFRIDDHIDETYQIGLFAEPGRSFDAWIRFSNADVLRRDDLSKNRMGHRSNGSRGMAIKVMDVDGDIIPSKTAHRDQDFLAINTPSFAFANVRDYLRLNRVLEITELGHDPTVYFLPAAARDAELSSDERATIADKIAQFPIISDLNEEEIAGTLASARVVREIEKLTVRNPLEIRYYGAAPFAFGAGRVMKFSAAPCTPKEQQPFPEVTDEFPSRDYLRHAVTETLQEEDPICLNFQIQVRDADSDGLHMEDATQLWPGELDRYETVARIDIPAPQFPQTTEAIENCEQLAFSPWHTLAAHRPLGGINRLRQQVYFGSATERSAKGY